MYDWTQSNLDTTQQNYNHDMNVNIEMTYRSWSHNTSNLVHGVQMRTQSSMNGEYLFIDDSGNWHVIEKIDEKFHRFVLYRRLHSS
jgi:hypothetical protein